jgi:hypothetical protein
MFSTSCLEKLQVLVYLLGSGSLAHTCLSTGSLSTPVASRGGLLRMGWEVATDAVMGCNEGVRGHRRFQCNFRRVSLLHADPRDPAAPALPGQ